MGLLKKIKETSISVLPIVTLVLILNFTVAPLGAQTVREFLVSAVLVIIGLSVFLLGTDMGVVPVGHAIGNSLTRLRNMPVMLAAGFIIGFGVTVAEPDVQVLVGQIVSVKPYINADALLYAIGAGVGLFVSLALARILFNLKFRALIVINYLLVFLLLIFTDGDFIGVAFDSGGATTGSMTVPFIMALGMGAVAVKQGSKNEESDENFGLAGLASIGPVMAVIVMGLVSPSSAGLADAAASASEAGAAADTGFLALIRESAADTAGSLLPLLAIFVVAQLFLIKLPRVRLRSVIIGVVYTYLGLVLFMAGVSKGFMVTGKYLAYSLSNNCSPAMVIAVGLVLGALVVCAEPAVWVLNKQVEDISGGHIRRSMMLVSLALGVAFAVAGSVARAYFNISYLCFIIPGYAVALALTFFSPPLFTAIAFDSGGVASGPMASTFLFAFISGVVNEVGGNTVTGTFGMIGLIAMMPLITIQLLGIIYKKTILDKEKV